MKRRLSEEERELFETTFRDARPLKKLGRKPAKKIAPATPKESATLAPTATSHSRGTGGGLDGRTAERLRRGVLEPEARLDLHGLTEDAAHRALATFLRGASARGLRLVIVVTGKGAKPAAPDEPFDLELNSRSRGVLKAVTPRWLKEPELARFVVDVRSAHRRHGGAGALYVYLRKPVR
ncbi:MAG: Smr/MutS family protein [Proteobacteria bacterium]|nr:Smr/MutS family protein [Pseudomonadota bacterium]